MKNLVIYAKASYEIVAKLLLVLVGIAFLLMGFGNFTIKYADIQGLAKIFGFVFIAFGLVPMILAYGKSVWPKGGKK